VQDSEANVLAKVWRKCHQTVCIMHDETPHNFYFTLNNIRSVESRCMRTDVELPCA
jgi:hypothetical protein